MSALAKGALVVAAALAIASITPASAQKMKEGMAMIIQPSGKVVMMKHKHGNTVPPGYSEVMGHTDEGNTAMIMVGGKMYMKSGVSGRDISEQYQR